MSNWRSVHFDNTYRFNKAKEQKNITPKTEKEIYEYVLCCLEKLNINIKNLTFEKIKMSPPYTKEFYNNIKEEFALDNTKDILWMKFTQSGHLGVVAISDDINFDIPPSKNVYNEKNNNTWKYNTSGIIIHYLGEKWKKDYVFVFPLKSSNKIDNKKRHQIEKNIGDYLILNGVPILDYYSHRI